METLEHELLDAYSQAVIRAVELVVSSLAIHYVEDYAALMRRIAGWLAPGGVLV